MVVVHKNQSNLPCNGNVVVMESTGDNNAVVSRVVGSVIRGLILRSWYNASCFRRKGFSAANSSLERRFNPVKVIRSLNNPQIEFRTVLRIV